MDKRKNIVLIGMPTSGKSTVGVIAAKVLGMDFVDADIVIQQREGMRLSEIIDERGVDGFIECEGRALLSLNVTGTVIATGGSAIYSTEAMEKLSAESVIIYLKVEKDELYSRLKNVKERGVVLHEGETLDDMFKTRSMLYEKYANVIISEKGSSIEDTVNQVVEYVERC